jgi:hypothetical protein
MHRQFGKPAPLVYFDEIGVDPRASVDVILVTHWHDDHVAGIDLLAEECSNAEVWCSEALRCVEFLQVLEIPLQRPGLRFTRGVQHIGRLVDLRSKQIKFALADMRILQRNLVVAGAKTTLELWALSPSQYQNTLARERIGDLLPAVKDPQFRVPDTNQNHTCVAAALLVGANHVLLGSDLEETGDPRLGWSAVVASRSRPAISADAFKVPHHGSLNGHHDATWTNLLTRSPTTAVTPYNLGRSLPTNQDVQRILNLSGQALISCAQPRRRPKRRQNSVQKLLPKTLHQLPMIPGHIQLRKSLTSPTSPWQFRLFDGAGELKNYQAR